MGWIVAYKIAKVLLTFAGGVAALSLRHQNLVDFAHNWLLRLGFDPGGRICADLLARLANINPNHLQWLGCVLFLYSALYLTEGLGLYFEKRWAEWFTVFQTSLIIPLEIYGLWLRSEPAKWIFFATSVTTVTYLIWRIRHDRRIEIAAGQACTER